jgi:hypothetical protein
VVSFFYVIHLIRNEAKLCLNFYENDNKNNLFSVIMFLCVLLSWHFFSFISEQAYLLKFYAPLQD